MMNVIGEIMPCHNPSQNPAAWPPAANSPCDGFGPAAQPVRRSIAMSTKNVKFVLTGVPPHVQGLRLEREAGEVDTLEQALVDKQCPVDEAVVPAVDDALLCLDECLDPHATGDLECELRESEEHERHAEFGLPMEKDPADLILNLLRCGCVCDVQDISARDFLQLRPCCCSHG